MRANRLSGSEGGAGANPLFLPLSILSAPSHSQNRWSTKSQSCANEILGWVDPFVDLEVWPNSRYCLLLAGRI